jgi:hypothetical protein
VRAWAQGRQAAPSAAPGPSPRPPALPPQPPALHRFPPPVPSDCWPPLLSCLRRWRRWRRRHWQHGCGRLIDAESSRLGSCDDWSHRSCADWVRPGTLGTRGGVTAVVSWRRRCHARWAVMMSEPVSIIDRLPGCGCVSRVEELLPREPRRRGSCCWGECCLGSWCLQGKYSVT